MNPTPHRLVLAIVLLAALSAGCSPAHYRTQADQAAAAILAAKQREALGRNEPFERRGAVRHVPPAAAHGAVPARVGPGVLRLGQPPRHRALAREAQDHRRCDVSRQHRRPRRRKRHGDADARAGARGRGAQQPRLPVAQGGRLPLGAVARARTGRLPEHLLRGARNDLLDRPRRNAHRGGLREQRRRDARAQVPDGRLADGAPGDRPRQAPHRRPGVVARDPRRRDACPSR